MPGGRRATDTASPPDLPDGIHKRRVRVHTQEAHDAGDTALERYMHLFALNRGILLTPFHNMALMSPATNEADIDRHTEVFREAVLELAG